MEPASIPISANIEHDNTPWPLPDGRILYQRWEYIDRSQVHYHHLWTANPDGTNPMPYFGNQNPDTLMIDAKPIPGTDEIVTIFSPGHGRKEHAGRVVVLNPRLGPDDTSAVRVIHQDNRLPRSLAAVRRTHSLPPATLKSWPWTRKAACNHCIALSEADRKAGFWIHEPRPVLARKREIVIPPRTDLTKPTGKLILANVLEGRNMAGVRPGEIRKLLVVESLPKPINYTGGMDPLTYGGSFTLERIVGTVPVEADGSAYFELPAQRSFFLVALDENDLSVKRMQSFLSVQPGEVTSCVGCHEQRTRTIQPQGALLALSRPPSIITPETDVPDVFDFPRDIQPILDEACGGCHGYEKTAQGGPYAGRVDPNRRPRPDVQSQLFHAHRHANVLGRPQQADPATTRPGRSAPLPAGCLKIIDGSHHGATFTPIQEKTVRLWIEAAATYPGTYAALGTGSIGGYEENRQVNTDHDWPASRSASQVIDTTLQLLPQRLRPIQTSPQPVRRTRPLVLATENPPPFANHQPPSRLQPHQARKIDDAPRTARQRRPAATSSAMVPAIPRPFSPTTRDPGYQTLLAMITQGRNHLDTITRFDMPHFKPHPAYVREMKRYGILPPDTPADTKINPYDTDRRYWESLWHTPIPNW